MEKEERSGSFAVVQKSFCNAIICWAFICRINESSKLTEKSLSVIFKHSPKKYQEGKFPAELINFPRWSKRDLCVFSSFLTVRHCTVFSLVLREVFPLLLISRSFYRETWISDVKCWAHRDPWWSGRRVWATDCVMKKKHRKTVIIASLFSLTLQ